MRRPISPPVGTVLLLLAALPAAAAAAPSYERHRVPQPMTPAQRHILAAAQRWGVEHQRPLQWDPRLNLAAAALLPFAPHQSNDPLPLQPLRQAAWEQGWTDGQLAAVAVRLATPAAPAAHIAAVLQGALSERLAGVEVNRVGVAVHQTAAEMRVVVALSRQLVHLVPVSARLGTDTFLVVAGRLPQHPARPSHVSLAVALPGGALQRLAPQTDTTLGTFDGRLLTGPQAGIMNVQVLVDRGRGPEVAALFPVGVDAAPWPTQAPQADPSAEAPTVAAASPQALTDLIWGARAAHALPLPSLHPSLTAAAVAHGDDMRTHHYFAHVSGTDGDALWRLGERGLEVSRVLENIADASDVETAFAQWMASPAHRLNILDPDVNVMGVAVGPGTHADSVLAVLVLARLADSGTDAELAAAALDVLQQARLARGLEPFAGDAELAALATKRSRANAVERRLGDGTQLLRQMLEAGWQRCAADFYRGATVRVVAQSPHLEEAFERVGVGIYQAQTGHNEPRLWITVLYAGAAATP